MNAYFVYMWLGLGLIVPTTKSMQEEVPMSAVFLYRDAVHRIQNETICADRIHEKTISQGHSSSSPTFPLVNMNGVSNQSSDLAVVVQSDELYNLTRLSPKNKIAYLFLNSAQFPGTIKIPMTTETNVLVLSAKNFEQLQTAATKASVFVAVLDDRPQKHSPFNTLVTVFLVNLCALSSLLFGCWMTYLNREKLLDELKARSSMLGQSKCGSYLVIGGLVLVASAMLLLYYFFYDITVYLAIALFCFLGAIAIVYVLTFWIKRLCVRNERKLTLKFQIRNRPFSYGLSTISLAMLPLGITYMAIWLVYRNNPDIGWPMQSVAGIFLIMYLLSVSIPLPSLKIITILYFAFVFYDIFFVFITRAFSSTRTPDPPSVTEMTLSRAARSADPHGFMEAVALGTAGQSGESIPATFRWRLREFVGMYGCSYRDDSMLLGFGDAVIPGFLSAFLIFYDALWKVRFLRHFVASFIGYIVGIGLAFLVSMLSQSAQPALIYLCPCSLGFAVLTAGILGGKVELTRLWNGQFPVIPQPPTYTATPDEQGYEKNVDSTYPFQGANAADRPPVTTGDVFNDSCEPNTYTPSV